MNAEYVVYAFLGEVVFAAMAAVALLTLAALLKVMPPKALPGRQSGSEIHARNSANGGTGTDCLDRQTESVEGMLISTKEHPGEPKGADLLPLTEITSSI